MRLRVKIVSAVLAISVSLLALEALVRILLYVGLADLSPSVRRERDWRAVHRTADQILTRERYSFDEFSRTLGWQPKPNLRTQAITTNSQGLRGTREYDVQAPTGVRRILCIGDSFIFGENLTDEETLPAQLEKALSRTGRWEVLNLGVHGYGTDQQWLRLQELGFQYKADVVVLGVFEDGLQRNILSFRDYAKPYFELVGRNLVVRSSPVPSPQELLSHPLRSPECQFQSWCALQWPIEKMLMSFPTMPDLEYTQAGKVTLALLDTISEESRRQGMTLVLMAIPRRLRPEPTKVEAMLLRWAARTRTPMINLRQEFLKFSAAQQKALYAGHWTAYGAAVAANLAAHDISKILHD